MTNYILILYGLVMGTIYPAYKSFCAIQTNDSSDDIQWLTYWIIVSFWTLINSVLNYTLFWLPFFEYLNPLFLTWLVHPKLMGAKTCFNCFVKPFFYQFHKFENGKIVKLGYYERIIFMTILKLKSVLENKMDDFLKHFSYIKHGWIFVYPYLLHLKDAYLMNSSLININEILKRIDEYKRVLSSDRKNKKKDSTREKKDSTRDKKDSTRDNKDSTRDNKDSNLDNKDSSNASDDSNNSSDDSTNAFDDDKNDISKDNTSDDSFSDGSDNEDDKSLKKKNIKISKKNDIDDLIS